MRLTNSKIRELIY